ncbi:VWA domain-containing protein [Marinomonas colpomeniae]|uniref:VWA domain-containing protein n=1 Tax=Marinomonas colpomeniae TaxID=2774408 RepID=A0ABR8P0N2_9GAMM|nr:VWA domain-containing protein [Marinomonas colpomeniae]MBD5771852.1 VWA domain-containing protein [Marinomonas colpomeniae]
MKWLKINTVLLLSAVVSFWTPVSQADTQFRVIVDASGSMLISDPDKLTSEALRLISNLAPEEEATLGIWLFGEAPRVLLPESIVNKATKAKLASYVDSYVTQDVKTDLEAIVKVLLDTPDAGGLEAGFNRHWILVTDGMVDISLDEAVNKASRDRILNGLTEKLEENGIHLHTISMTGYTDKELLESISLRTDATHTEVAIPEDLLDTFDRIFSQASPSDELPFDGNRFTVDDAIDELTLVVFHENGIQPHIIKPNGKILSLIDDTNVSVSASDHYTLITVSKPDIGNWQINNVDLERSSIRIITHLSAQATKVAPVIFQNEPIYSTVGLFEKDTLIQDEGVLDLLTVTQTLVLLNGEKKETIFSHKMDKTNSQFKKRLEGITAAGNYELISVVDGKTFSRQLSQYFTVHPGIEFKGMNTGGNLVEFSAKPVNLKLNVMRSNVQIEFTYENGSTDTELMPLLGQGYWNKVVPVSSGDQVKVRAKLIGVTQTGLRFDYWTPYWNFNREGDNEATVILGDVAPIGILLTSVPSQNRDVMPMLVPPAVSIVDDQEDSEPSNYTVPNEEAMSEEELTAEEDDQKTESLSTSEWIMYGALNFGVLLLIGAGIFLYRLSKKNKSAKSDDIENV